MMKTVFVYLRVILTFALIMPPSGGSQAKELVKNGGFEIRSNPGSNLNKDYFINVQPTDWAITQAPGTSLAHIVAPNFATANPLPVYGPFPSSSAGGTSTAGGYFLESDGDPQYSGLITQTIILPKAGDYVVSFLQAAGQQNHPTYTSPTSEWWEVSLGGAPTQSSPVFNLSGPNAPGAPATNVGQWQPVSMTFQNLPAGPSVLSLLANGLPGGQPPICFLDNVSVPGVPEPGSLLIVGVGLLVSVAVGRFRAKSAAV